MLHLCNNNLQRISGLGQLQRLKDLDVSGNPMLDVGSVLDQLTGNSDRHASDRGTTDAPPLTTLVSVALWPNAGAHTEDHATRVLRALLLHNSLLEFVEGIIIGPVVRAKVMGELATIHPTIVPRSESYLVEYAVLGALAPVGRRSFHPLHTALVADSRRAQQHQVDCAAVQHLLCLRGLELSTNMLVGKLAPFTGLVTLDLSRNYRA